MSDLQSRVRTLCRLRRAAESAARLGFLARRFELDAAQARQSQLAQARRQHEHSARQALGQGTQISSAAAAVSQIRQAMLTSRPQLQRLRAALEAQRARLLWAMRQRQSADVLLERLQERRRLEAHRVEVKEMDELQHSRLIHAQVFDQELA